MHTHDTTISFSTKNTDDLITTINNDLASLEEWFYGNKLSLNVVRTQPIMISSKHEFSRCDHPDNTAVFIRISANDFK